MQFVHTASEEATVVWEYFPGMQSVHTESTVREYFPAMQSQHTETPVAVAVWNFPSTHDVHVAAPEEVDPTGPYLPAAHMEPEQAPSPAPFLQSTL